MVCISSLTLSLGLSWFKGPVQIWVLRWHWWLVTCEAELHGSVTRMPSSILSLIGIHQCWNANIRLDGLSRVWRCSTYFRHNRVGSHRRTAIFTFVWMREGLVCPGILITGIGIIISPYIVYIAVVLSVVLASFWVLVTIALFIGSCVYALRFIATSCLQQNQKRKKASF